MLTSYSDALSRVLAKATEVQARSPSRLEAVALTEASGRVLGQVVTARYDQPKFDNSAVDGYAVRASDGPSFVEVVGTTFAGSRPNQPLEKGAAVKIMTGAPLPGGSDAVVMRERVTEEGGRIQIPSGVQKGDFVRRKSEEFSAGEILLEPGVVLGPTALALAASQGDTHVQVRERLRALVVSTGDEVVDLGLPVTEHQIYDSNRVSITSSLLALGVKTDSVHAADDRGSLLRALGAATDYDLVLTIGGVSAGDRDLVPQIFDELGITKELHGVDMRPGKPFYFGTKERTLVFGLPGNPVSSLMCTFLFVRAAVHALNGSMRRDLWIPVEVDREVETSRGDTFSPVSLVASGDRVQAQSIAGPGSHLLGGIAKADAILWTVANGQSAPRATAFRWE